MDFDNVNSMINIVLSRLKRLKKLYKITFVNNLSSEIKEVAVSKRIIEETIKKKKKYLSKSQMMILDNKLKKISFILKKIVYDV